MTPWDKFWSGYLFWSIRICCYFSGLYFFSAFAEAISGRFSILADAVILLYGIACSEAVARIVKKLYRPNFVCEDDSPSQKQYGRLVLNRESYDYRRKAEITIYELIGFFGINFILACILLAKMPSANIQLMVAGGLCGLGSAFFNFIGSVLMVIRGANKAAAKGEMAIPRIIGIAFILPAYFYIAYAIKRFIIS